MAQLANDGKCDACGRRTQQLAEYAELDAMLCIECTALADDYDGYEFEGWHRNNAR